MNETYDNPRVMERRNLVLKSDCAAEGETPSTEIPT